uniref:Kinesin-like protein n=1 Tax=Saccoglossus kowalevskii TaxID=10224 RepID=A0ABM0M9X8_SACKO|nr:PREDICTED: kinesin-like protein KIF12-like [Saccoglossus kowalevskii]
MDSQSDNTDSPLSDTAEPTSEKADTRVNTLSGLSQHSTRSSLTSAPDAHFVQDESEDSSIKVVVRVRPLNDGEITRHDSMAIELPGNNNVVIDQPGKKKSFTFNAVFELSASQQDVFDNCGIKQLIEMSIDGYASTAFAYGQTGSGKTYTITGPFNLNENPNPELYGMIQRSFEYLFMNLQKNTDKAGITYTLSASYLEIYNEQVKDLLNPSQRDNLLVRWSKTKGFYVENLFLVECETIDDMLAVLEEGLSYRQTGSNNINEHSSRSHSMLTIFIDSEVVNDDTLYITKQGKLSFVDLAGSEKIKELGNTGDLLSETTNINKSLLTLGNCISSLSDPKKKNGYIPYRDSKLTKLLADSLGGNGVTLMIACVSPSTYSVSESMNTIRYANRAKKIKNKPVIRMDPREKLIMSLKRECKLLRSENDYLRTQFTKKLNGGEILQLPKMQTTTNGHVAVNSSKNSQVKKVEDVKKEKSTRRESTNSSISTSLSMKSAADNGLYEMLQEYMVENENLRSENNELVGSRERARREHEHLSKENDKLVRKMEDLERYSFFSRTSSGRSSRPLVLGSVNSSWSEATTALFQQDTTPQMQYPPPQYQQPSLLPRQSPLQQPPPGQPPPGLPAQAFQQYSQQQQLPPPPPPQQAYQGIPHGSNAGAAASNPTVQRDTRVNGHHQPPLTYRKEQVPPKKQLHELPPVDNMKGVPNNYKASKQPPYQQQKIPSKQVSPQQQQQVVTSTSKNKPLESPRGQDGGSYVDRFQQQQTFNKSYGPPVANRPHEQTTPRQANINIPPVRGLERKDDYESGSPHQTQILKQVPLSTRSSTEKLASNKQVKSKADNKVTSDPFLNDIPPTPVATPPAVKYTPKGSHQMLQVSTLDVSQNAKQPGNWDQINDKLREELQELDGEIEYMKYMNKSQTSTTTTTTKPTNKPVPKPRRR